MLITGTNGDDTLVGTTGDDDISGLAGNDQIDGGAGNDTLSGGTGGNIVLGGAGSDLVVLDASGGDIAFGGAGFDTARIAIDADPSVAFSFGTPSNSVFVNGQHELIGFERLERYSSGGSLLNVWRFGTSAADSIDISTNGGASNVIAAGDGADCNRQRVFRSHLHDIRR